MSILGRRAFFPYSALRMRAHDGGAQDDGESLLAWADSFADSFADWDGTGEYDDWLRRLPPSKAVHLDALRWSEWLRYKRLAGNDGVPAGSSQWHSEHEDPAAAAARHGAERAAQCVSSRHAEYRTAHSLAEPRPRHTNIALQQIGASQRISLETTPAACSFCTVPFSSTGGCAVTSISFSFSSTQLASSCSCAVKFCFTTSTSTRRRTARRTRTWTMSLFGVKFESDRARASCEAACSSSPLSAEHRHWHIRPLPLLLSEVSLS